MGCRETYLRHSIEIEIIRPAPEIELDFVMIQTTAPISSYFKTSFVFLDGVKQKVFNL
jgi:hypothetical protein